jgi:putative ABC transport system permease protein
MSGERRFRRLFGPDPERDVDDELSFHVEMRERELVAQGETPERARELALRRFGDMRTPRAECVTIRERQGRRMARTEYVAELKQDMAYALRALRKRPGFTAVAVLTLGLGIGANSAIFSVVNGVLLQSLPYAHADRLYEVQMIYPDGARYTALSAPDFMSVAELNRVFEEFGAYDAFNAPLVGLGEPKEVLGAQVSDGLFGMLGHGTVLGRSFSSEEHEPGRGAVAVLDHGFWQREFGGAPDALGRTVAFAGESYTVVGVLAPGAGLPLPARIYFPLVRDEGFSSAAAAGRRSEYLSTLGRARPGLTTEQVAADLLRVSQQLAVDFPDSNERLTMGVRSLRESIIGDVRRPLLVLLGAVGVVLLVACANVANLLLARASARQGELAVRAALGAGRGRLVRQLLTESVVLGAIGGAAGLAIGWAGTRALVAAQPADIPRLEGVGMDTTVVLVTMALALFTGLLFGAIPALQATHGALAQALREGSKGLQGAAGQRVRSALIVAEMALAVVLLVGAGLLIRSFIELTRVNPGFRAEQALAFRVAMDPATYADGEQIRQFVGELLERVNATAGVTSAGGTGVLPLRGRGSLINFSVDNAPPPPDDVNQEIGYFSVTPGYFETIGTPIVQGRGFTEFDRAGEPPVALINEAGARFWFPGENPIGRSVTIGNTSREVVGVVADVLQRNPGTAAMPQLLAPYGQQTTRTLQIVARTAGEPLAVAPSLRALLRSLDPNMPISDFTPLEQVVSDSVARPRFYTSLLALFAAVALILAAIGIFGVMSYSVTQRAREISIRMALGARGGEVIRMIVGRSMALAGLGLLIGIGSAAALGRVISSQLYNVRVMDPLTLGAVVLALGGSALAASWLPARRAAALDPGTALRES